MDLDAITTPKLLLDKVKTQNNIEAMTLKCKNQGIELRPHFKTHQSLEIGRWFRSYGIKKITVSSLRMAEYFASDGWNDILIAFPFNPREMKGITKLASRIKLTLTVPCLESAKLLSELCSVKLDVMIKIDTGYGRSGISWNQPDYLNDTFIALELNLNIKVRGILTHSGHTYKTNKRGEVIKIYKETIDRMQACKRSLKRENLLISAGDTPSASIVDTLSGAQELRPGNFVFYDLMQSMIGSCGFDNIGVAVACPVVDINIKRNKAVIYGGGVHLSKESIQIKGNQIYGMLVDLTKEGWTPFKKNIYLTGLSQEHGIIESHESLPESVKVGGLIGIIPVHSCLTANLLAEYTLFDGSTIDHMNNPKNN